MINPGDVYKYSEKIPILSGEQAEQDATNQIGTIFADYEVKEYTDVRNLSSVRSYIVTCKQRIVVPNPAGLLTLTDSAVESYDRYPVMLVTGIGISAVPAGCRCVLLDYSPKTVNTSVTTSTANSTSSGSSDTVSSQQSSGRSVSDTSSYEVSGSIGFFGDALTGSVGASHGASHTTSSYSSVEAGAAHTGDAQRSASGSSAMSIKDWGSYASITSSAVPSWVWAQEYPWDVNQFHNIDPATGYVQLPNFVQGRLVDQMAGFVYPPSQLSLFGVNFVATAKWLIETPSTYSSADETVSFSHSVSCTQASHTVGPEVDDVYSAIATLDTLKPFQSTGRQGIDMVKLALDPVVEEGSRNGAVVGFLKAQFLSLPPTAVDGFRIKSAANNILVTGSGFAPPATYSAPMTADLKSGAVTFNIFFKVIGALENITLFLKSWISDSSSRCYLAINVNGLSTIYRHIDATENGDGSDNVTAVTLRSQDFSSPDFYDYVLMGLNQITVTVSPSSDPTHQSAPGVYSIRAVAIG